MESESHALVRTLFKDDQGEPFLLTPGQETIFDCVAKRQYPRVRILCPTRYGKSRTLAMALIARASTFPEKWAIIAPSATKARIIMDYALEHALENDYTRGKLEMDKDMDLDRLRRERSKSRLTFRMDDKKGQGELFILSTESHRTTKRGEAVIGQGAANIVLDESSLIDDDIYSMVKRMLGDAVNGDSCLVEVGNPFRRNHFKAIGNDPAYHQIFIDYRQAVAEGRLTQDFIEEMRKEMFFDILYECKFPDQDSVDEDGWSSLITEDILRLRQRDEPPIGVPRMGVDVAHGGTCWNVWTIRYDNMAYVVRKDHERDLMAVSGRTETLAEEHGVDPRNVTIDGTGVGAGVVDRLWERKFNCQSFIAGEKAEDDARFVNRKAEACWRFREWMTSKGFLVPDKDWDECLDIKWKVDSGRRIRIMPKDIMAKRGIASPDVFDSIALTCSTNDFDRPTQRMNDDARELLDIRRKERGGMSVIGRI